MSEYSAEEKFFHDISSKVIDLVNQEGSISVAVQKGDSDYSTTVDLAVEDLIVSEINQRFPEDLILAEENHNQTIPSKGRVWIIDPICGTVNLAKGINNFCTNIALADNGQLLASCVVDHSQNIYIWSTGNSKIHINNSLYKHTSNPSTVIDIDLGSLPFVYKTKVEKLTKTAFKILSETNFQIISLNTSLSFAYTAIGKVDGFINIYNHPWDICAAAFLIQQSGGMITDPEGNNWKIDSVGAIGAKNAEVHKTLLGFYKSA